MLEFVKDLYYYLRVILDGQISETTSGMIIHS